jgi:hypothetical protein
MRHLLMDPAFPDLLRQLEDERKDERCANDNGMDAEELSDPLLIAFARAEIAATRCW